MRCLRRIIWHGDVSLLDRIPEREDRRDDAPDDGSEFPEGDVADPADESVSPDDRFLDFGHRRLHRPLLKMLEYRRGC